MNIKAILISIILLAVEVNCHAVRLKVHPDEQAAMDALLSRLNIDEKNIIVGENEHQTNYYSDYFDAGVRYFHKQKGDGVTISVITDINERVARLRIINSNIHKLNEIIAFKSLKLLSLNHSKISNLNGIDVLKDLVMLDIVANDSLINIGGIKDLPNLIEIKAVTLKNTSIKGMKNLPKLERFLCDLCLIDDIAPLSGLTSLKVLKMGIKQKKIDLLGSLSNLEVLEIEGANLEDASAINRLKKIKTLKIMNTNVKEIPLSSELLNLQKIRIGNSPIRKIPDLSKFNNLKHIAVFGSEIGNVDTIYGMGNLEELVLIRNKNMKEVTNIKNLPNLKQLELENSPLELFETGALPNLEELKLSKTNISKLINFEKYPSLRRLIINDTKIKSLKGIEKAPMLYSVQADYDVKNDPDNRKILRSLRKNIFKRKPQ